MSPAAVAVLARVRAAGAELQADGDNLRWRAPEPLPSDLLESMKARKDELLAALQSVPTPNSDTYRLRITGARSWGDLYAILSDAEVAYADGELSGEEVEELASVCAREAHTLPDHHTQDK